MAEDNNKKPTFIDLFAGCGGISLGMCDAGWRGIFAIEKAGDAFATFQENFLKGPLRIRFNWPEWLGVKPHAIGNVLRIHRSELLKLRGEVEVVAGGPPCQGFSYAGRRKRRDPRNRLFEKYVEFVDTVRPKAVVLENVPGMQVVHGAKNRGKSPRPGPIPSSYYEKLVEALRRIGYVAEGRLIDAAGFGVPQRRPRLVVVGFRKDIARNLENGVPGIFEILEECRKDQLRELGLPDPVSARMAISDLVIGRRKLAICSDPALGRGTFFEVKYKGPMTQYQVLMHAGLGNAPMDSMRLANHTKMVSNRFKKILRECPNGILLSNKHRIRLGLLKHRIYPMSPNKPSPTLTTLPDDILHYKEPRILTVRESARLQSFPDWFKFRGVYTSGGDRRKKACPRFTQVGNAVPPLLARAIGSAIALAIAKAEKQGAEKLGRKGDANGDRQLMRATA